MTSMTLKRTAKWSLPMGILGSSIAPDGSRLSAACMDGVYDVDLTPGQPSRLGEHNSYVSSVVRLQHSDVLLSAGYDGNVHWYRKSDGSFQRHISLHDFWSWDMAVSPNERLLASVTGQYLAGGYRYEPAAESEPSVRVVDVHSGKILHSLPHVPSVQAVAFSPDSRYVAAGNLMGEVRVWQTDTGQLVRTIKTDGFTTWGIIKSHCYLGGIFALKFTPDGDHLLLAGMGPMRDPMAGNGKQRWEKWAWNQESPQRIDTTHKKEAGEGLMETLALHPDGRRFLMGGRLRGGDWNAAVFDLNSGDRLTTLKSGYRITEAHFTADCTRLVVTGLTGQPTKKKNGRFRDFGRVEVYDVS